MENSVNQTIHFTKLYSSGQHSGHVREVIKKKKNGLVMEFFHKGGGGGGFLTQSITLGHIFCVSRVTEFLLKIQGYGHFWALFIKNIILKMAILGSFFKVCFSTF